MLTNSSPSRILLDGVSVYENAATGTRIGRLSASDPDGDSLSFTLIENAEGRFRIENGYVVVADGSKLDYEAETSHPIIVRVTDGNGNIQESLFYIRVQNIVEDDLPPPPPENQAPEVIRLTFNRVGEETINGFIVGTVRATDADGEALT